ncbi:hypothetical protein LY90DRAFT_519893 [Neocallimastix californiae]|uniref:RNI-like protein n=1 Tax=Neocallimastix californiae TaxID=1754190 RepID=A0A1Y1YP44_9FUNG|nr:hypothetical protein LY90DRAFT_519893 [Neocallimastix californiae]|eukprot:ORX99536.1 hypothetical protein LY90DRAFT_519893 [Neocallimastix californiae]
MKFIRTLVYSFLTLGALASQCDDAKKYGKSLDTGSISFKCDSNGKVTELSVRSELPAFKYAKNLKTLKIIGNTSVDKEDIKIISKFTELEKLKIDVREVSTKDLSYLKNLKHLKEFKLVDDRSEDNLCNYVPKEIKSICYPKDSASTKKTTTKKTTTKKTSTKTTKSKTTATSVTVNSNDDLVSIKGSTKVKKIELHRISLKQNGVDALATLTGLETIEFVDCDYYSPDLKASSLKNLKNLRKLIANSRHDIILFKNNDSLKSLTVYGNTSLNKDDIKIIARFTKLEKLEIDVNYNVLN